jgi:integrative and conjugative element protein (TIGR02256 family)
MNGIVFRRQGGAVIKLDSGPLHQLLGFRQLASSDVEAGGVLLGRYILGCRDVVVDEVTTPMAGDQRTRLSFHRNPQFHQQVIDERWKSSRGTCHYLGEWHTHPEPLPTPSRIDLEDWRRRLREDRYPGDSLFFVIVGTREVAAWEGSQSPPGLDRLTPLGPGRLP